MLCTALAHSGLAFKLRKSFSLAMSYSRLYPVFSNPFPVSRQKK